MAKFKMMKFEKQDYLVLAVSLTLLVSLYIIGNIERNDFKRDCVYSIGTLTKIKKLKNVWGMEISYPYNGSMIVKENITSTLVNYSMENKRFYVRFLTKNTDKMEFICCTIVPDSIKDVPSDGWKVPPTSFDAIQIMDAK